MHPSQAFDHPPDLLNLNPQVLHHALLNILGTLQELLNQLTVHKPYRALPYTYPSPHC